MRIFINALSLCVAVGYCSLVLGYSCSMCRVFRLPWVKLMLDCQFDIFACPRSTSIKDRRCFTFVLSLTSLTTFIALALVNEMGEVLNPC